VECVGSRRQPRPDRCRTAGTRAPGPVPRAPSPPLCADCTGRTLVERGKRERRGQGEEKKKGMADCGMRRRKGSEGKKRECTARDEEKWGKSMAKQRTPIPSLHISVLSVANLSSKDTRRSRFQQEKEELLPRFPQARQWCIQQNTPKPVPQIMHSLRSIAHPTARPSKESVLVVVAAGQMIHTGSTRIFSNK